MAGRVHAWLTPNAAGKVGWAPMRDSLGPQRPKPEQTQPTSEERSVSKK